MVKTLLAATASVVIAWTSFSMADEAVPYDLLFKNGTLDQFGAEAELVYERQVTSTLNPAADTRDSGDIVLYFQEDQATMARLELRQGERARGLGVFPASVGNPMIMYFYESAVRDMAEATGGSIFYIRNRIKDALVQPAETTAGEAQFGGETIATQVVRLYPFRNDPNADRMRGYGDLELRVTMSDTVPGWYLNLTAETDASDAPVYRSTLDFKSVEDLK